MGFTAPRPDELGLLASAHGRQSDRSGGEAVEAKLGEILVRVWHAVMWAGLASQAGGGKLLLKKWIVVLAVAVLLGLALVAPLTAADNDDDDDEDDEFEVDMLPGPFAPGAEGELEFRVRNGVLWGEFEAEDLPNLGLHAFYVLWYVNMDTGDKAFLGPIVHKDSILSLTEGELRFRAIAFTDPDGPNAGSGIFLGPDGTNFFVLIAENEIDTFVPHPVSPPDSSFALTATV